VHDLDVRIRVPRPGGLKKRLGKPVHRGPSVPEFGFPLGDQGADRKVGSDGPVPDRTAGDPERQAERREALQFGRRLPRGDGAPIGHLRGAELVSLDEF